jgi:hypothetical protein
MRNVNQGLSGMTSSGIVQLPPYTYNLALNGSTADVQFPPDNVSSNSLLTSLWTYSSTSSSTNLNATTVNMQTIDANNFYINNAGLTGATGAYYAVRVNTDTTLTYANVNINCINLS